MTDIAKLEPTAVWEHFQTLCDIPRPSKHEEQVRDYMKGWAELRGLETVVDKVGNLIIRKPATPGYEDRAGVVLQGHLDMVCQANSGTEHDFFKDPIRPVLKDGWLVAENTTLGADNGIGVALGMAVLSGDDVAHGPVEVLLTLDEEAGMGGALGLETGLLRGQYLINIDTEEWGEFYMGCAGGVDVNVTREYAVEAVPAGFQTASLTIKGLKGGHSGADIHLGRGNANKILIRLLRELEAETELRLSSLQGGTARNALSREAFAVVAYPTADAAKVAAKLDAFQALMRFELAGVDEGVSVLSEAAPAAGVLARADQDVILAALHAAPHGVKRMSQRVEGVVETSNNLGVVSVADGKVFANLMVRSLLDSGTWMLAREAESLFKLAAFKVEMEGGYPGWAPNPQSKLLALFKDVYRREFGGEAEVQVIHAGLECGILGSKYPNLDMVSFGPNIRGAHAPGERVEVESVGKAWQLLQAVLKAIPAR
ncbi:Di- or tripeptidase [Chromobacterium violaceum]|uniref:Cytosol non-specific dipeptidase n=1 Tax=Chromobacterium violaceum TaxID=536 RepID=A0A202B5C8_CHRVL|nr:aminoacyl-histidine dipeptidase [Chromobacterium violaceum]KMN51659.1 aminoacyl-histidine dipeptidase [Chromobacterium violaceum]KMN84650.1 aminoacyl-histidine dipeptidase [Chromobacterium violaceum]KMN88607.1 aminoacyl-histidine dipeptidase [Chromobacterium violaceum]KMO05918.1 aminoacyl-histidine dipeptidase [Chromobacterium violaceum]MBA8736355.1 aminoacyl-histidine dipeptidase [Chromobacterium violaceum]